MYLTTFQEIRSLFFFSSFWIVSLTTFINKRGSSRDLIYSFEINNVVVPDANIFLWTAVSIADAAGFNRNGIKKFLANDLSASFIKSNTF